MLKLKCGLIYKPVKVNSYEDYDDYFLSHLNDAHTSNDKLANNYQLPHIKRMKEYGYVYNGTPDNMVYMVGLEDFNNFAYRIESRLYVSKQYRSNFWKSPDNYETIKYQINNHIHNCNLLFKSREAKNPAGFKISARLDNFFNDWIIFPKQIELRYKNNFQWIMYKNIIGNTDENIKKLYYKI